MGENKSTELILVCGFCEIFSNNPHQNNTLFSSVLKQTQNLTIVLPPHTCSNISFPLTWIILLFHCHKFMCVEYIKQFVLPNTLRLSSFSLSPALFLAMQVYSPSSSLETSIIVISEPSSLKPYFSSSSSLTPFLSTGQISNSKSVQAVVKHHFTTTLFKIRIQK